MKIQSKLPHVGTSIFAIMSAMAKEHEAINLSQGFPNFDCDPVLQNYVQQAVTNGLNQYAPMGGLPILTEAIAEKSEAVYGKKLNPSTEITITAGATQAIFTAIQTFVHTWDEVILIEPAYDSYAPAVELCGGIVVPYILQTPDFTIDWEVFKTLISPKTRLIVVNTPHNPTGKIWKKDDWQELAAIVEGTEILILSDEVYEHIVFDDAKHHSILDFPELWQRTLHVSSFGKTFHTTGWKLGYLLAPEPLMREFRKIHQFIVFSVNTPIQWATAMYLKTGQESYQNLSKFYQQKRDLFLQAIENSRFQPIPCEGTYFQLLDYSEISHAEDTDFAIEMTQDFGVAAIPISVFCTNGESVGRVIRLCFAKTDETLLKAATRLVNL